LKGLSADGGSWTMVNTLVPIVPVPVNGTWALLMLILMLLATGWYFTPSAMRRY
jgi:hypothetical protein